MPPHGLYPVPQHHLYNNNKSRPSFNTMDFAYEESEATAKPLPQQDGAGDVKKQKRNKKKQEHSHVEYEDEGVPASAAKSASPNMKSKRSSKDQGKEDRKPVSHSSRKKRRRESENIQKAHGLTPIAPGDCSVIGGDMLKNLETSMGDVSSYFTQWSSPTKKPSNLPMKSTEKKANTKSNDPVDMLVATPTQLSGDPKKKKQKRKSGVGKATPSASSNAQTTSSTTKSPYATVPKKTHVPLPPPRQLSAFAALKMKEQEQKKEAPDANAIMFAKLPPSNGAKTLQHDQANGSYLKSSFNDALRAAISPQKREPHTPVRSARDSYYSSDSDSPVSSDAQTTKHTILRNPNSPSRALNARYGLSPTSLDKVLNVRAMKQEEQAELIERQVSEVSSVATSLPSTSSSTSLPASFNRVGMPYARSGAGCDAFVLAETAKKDDRETHEESNLKVFKKTFRNAQKTVNFSDEQDYLNKYLTWNAENYSSVPYPCLSNVTGCNARKEETIQSAKEQGQIVHRFSETRGVNADAMRDASFRTQKAEDLLMTAVHSRIPVPIGNLTGEWKLFSPKYSEHHYDIYSLGQRTLTIYSVAGMKDEGIFTARLNIKPRPTSFVIQPFTAPPHASFRTTVVETTPEGENPVHYKIELVFLGNGYLQLRADLNSLLRGKPTEAVGGKSKYMEFLGVHEKALQWGVEVKDEVEEEGRKLFAKYGSVDDD
jgi:hypothetical protein